MLFLLFAFIGIPALLSFLGLGTLAVIYALVVIPYFLILPVGSRGKRAYLETAGLLLLVWIFYYLVS